MAPGDRQRSRTSTTEALLRQEFAGPEILHLAEYETELNDAAFAAEAGVAVANVWPGEAEGAAVRLLFVAGAPPKISARLDRRRRRREVLRAGGRAAEVAPEVRARRAEWLPPEGPCQGCGDA